MGAEDISEALPKQAEAVAAEVTELLTGAREKIVRGHSQLVHEGDVLTEQYPEA